VGGRHRWSDIRDALGFKPGVAVLGALVLGASLSNVYVEPGSALDRIVFKGSASDGRQLLTVVTGTMITVTSLVFGLPVLTLLRAATTYSPRLLRSFLRDRGTQIVLSTFVGTVSYSLAGLYTVGTDHNGVPFVPRLAVSGALVLALISVCMLVYYIGHMTNAIRIDTIMRNVELTTRQVLRRGHPLLGKADREPDAEDPADVPGSAAILTSPCDGYVGGVDTSALLAVASRKRLTIRLLQLVGHHVVEGSPLVAVWRDDGSTPSPSMLRGVVSAIQIERERTSRAMSTGQNDAYTAVQAVHYLTDVLADAARRSFAVRRLRDHEGTVRVIVPVVGFPTHLKVVCGHIRQGGVERHPRVTLELLRMLGTLAGMTLAASRRDAVRRELDLADARRSIHPGADLDEVEDTAAAVRARLERSGAAHGSRRIRDEDGKPVDALQRPRSAVVEP
jgi:uncharacterized membrane protein